jgi:hypothetical protein
MLLVEKISPKFLKLAYTSYFSDKFQLFGFFGKLPEKAIIYYFFDLQNMHA